jgi:predicted lysophospholipase L1 biosynthesis ABC-type transport system permease subunit
MASRASPAPQYRLAVASRALAAIPLNYALTAIATALLARHLPLSRAEASVAATLASFLIFALIAMAIFHARSTAKVWAWMIGSTALLGALLALSLQLGGRA